MKWAGLTDVGRKRAGNEDNLLMLGDVGLFLVADGMGGHAGGEIASQMLVDTVREVVAQISGGDEDITWPDLAREMELDKETPSMVRLACSAITHGSFRVWERSQSDLHLKEMGTTVVCLVLTPGTAHTVHAGDSRCYRLRGKELTCLTTDHSMYAEYVRGCRARGEEPAPAEDFMYRNVILRAAGLKPTVKLELNKHQAEPGDLFLLCSDGLTGELSDTTIRRTLLAHLHDADARTRELRSRFDADACVRDLVRKANAHGGKDNITCIVVQV